MHIILVESKSRSITAAKRDISWDGLRLGLGIDTLKQSKSTRVGRLKYFVNIYICHSHNN